MKGIKKLSMIRKKMLSRYNSIYVRKIRYDFKKNDIAFYF